MAFAVSKGLNLKPVQNLKAAGLEPATVSLSQDKTLIVVLKADRPLGQEERSALIKAVRQVVPEAEPHNIPERGMVLEAKGVAFSRAKQIAKGKDKGMER